MPGRLERRWRELGAGDRERFARGWGIDAAAEMLEAAGARVYRIAAGPDARMSGRGRRLSACAGEFELDADELALAPARPCRRCQRHHGGRPGAGGRGPRHRPAARPAGARLRVGRAARGRPRAGQRRLSRALPRPRRSVRTRTSRQASRPSRHRFAPFDALAGLSGLTGPAHLLVDDRALARLRRSRDEIQRERVLARPCPPSSGSSLRSTVELSTSHVPATWSRLPPPREAVVPGLPLASIMARAYPVALHRSSKFVQSGDHEVASRAPARTGR